nr:uncharacterized protein LOC110359662 isoform X1 [Columba livia]
MKVPWRIVLQWWALLEHSNVILLKDCSASSNGMTQIKGLWRLYLHVKEIQCHGKRSSQCRGPDVGNFSPFQVQKKDSLMLGLCLCSATRYSKAQSSSLLLVARSPWHTWNSITTAQGEGVASLWGPDTKCLFLSFRMTLPAPPLSGDNDLIISFLAKILLCSPDPKRS